MHQRSEMGKGMDLNNGPIKFGGYVIEREGQDLVIQQRDYLKVKVSSLRIGANKDVSKTAVRKVNGAQAWAATQTCPQVAWNTSTLNQFITFDGDARKDANAAINRTLRLGQSGLRVKQVGLYIIYGQALRTPRSAAMTTFLARSASLSV